MTKYNYLSLKKSVIANVESKEMNIKELRQNLLL